jgi:hypothetical protein
MAKNAIKVWGQEDMSAVLLVAMITIISQQVNAAEAQNLVHWASVPHPPLLHVVSWKSPSISVFTTDSELVGGHSSGHLVPTFTIILQDKLLLYLYVWETCLILSLSRLLEKCSVMEWYSAS